MYNTNKDSHISERSHLSSLTFAEDFSFGTLKPLENSLGATMGITGGSFLFMLVFPWTLRFTKSKHKRKQQGMLFLKLSILQPGEGEHMQ